MKPSRKSGARCTSLLLFVLLGLVMACEVAVINEPGPTGAGDGTGQPAAGAPTPQEATPTPVQTPESVNTSEPAQTPTAEPAPTAPLRLTPEPWEPAPSAPPPTGKPPEFVVKAAPDLPAIDVDLAFLDPPELGREVELILTITPKHSTRRGIVKFLDLPQGFEFVSGDMEWEGALKGGESRQFSIIVKAVEKGNWTFIAGAGNTKTDLLMYGREHVLITDEGLTMSDTPILEPLPAEDGDPARLFPVANHHVRGARSTRNWGQSVSFMGEAGLIFYVTPLIDVHEGMVTFRLPVGLETLDGKREVVQKVGFLRTHTRQEFRLEVKIVSRVSGYASAALTDEQNTEFSGRDFASIHVFAIEQAVRFTPPSSVPVPLPGDPETDDPFVESLAPYLTFARTPELGREVDLILRVTTKSKKFKGVVKFWELPDGFELVSGEMEQKADLLPHETGKFSITVKAVKKGKWTLTAGARVRKGRGLLRDVVFVLIRDEGVIVSTRPIRVPPPVNDDELSKQFPVADHSLNFAKNPVFLGEAELIFKVTPLVDAQEGLVMFWLPSGLLTLGGEGQVNQTVGFLPTNVPQEFRLKVKIISGVNNDIYAALKDEQNPVRYRSNSTSVHLFANENEVVATH